MSTLTYAEQEFVAAQEHADGLVEIAHEESRFASLELEAPVSLLARRQEVELAVRSLRRELAALDTMIAAQMQEQGIRELPEGNLIAVLEPQSDRAKIKRDWLLGLLASGTLTPGEARVLMASEVRANLSGWDMLERRGLSPQEHGSREQQPAKIVIRERK